jgi:hypothetical protein
MVVPTRSAQPALRLRHIHHSQSGETHHYETTFKEKDTLQWQMIDF